MNPVPKSDLTPNDVLGGGFTLYYPGASWLHSMAKRDSAGTVVLGSGDTIRTVDSCLYYTPCSQLCINGCAACVLLTAREPYSVLSQRLVDAQAVHSPEVRCDSGACTLGSGCC